MMITSTAEFGTREISIGLDSNDARKIVGDEVWDAKSFAEQMDWLSKRTDIEVLMYLYKEGTISAEYLQLRVKAIKNR